MQVSAGKCAVIWPTISFNAGMRHGSCDQPLQREHEGSGADVQAGVYAHADGIVRDV